MQSRYALFLDITKIADFRSKMLMSAELKECVTLFMNFLNLLEVRYNCAKFHHCCICVTNFKEGGLPPNPWAAPKKPSWIGLIFSRYLAKNWYFKMKLSQFEFHQNLNFWQFEFSQFEFSQPNFQFYKQNLPIIFNKNVLKYSNIGYMYSRRAD